MRKVAKQISAMIGSSTMASELRQKAMVYVLSSHIAYDTPLPSSPVESVKQYYMDNFFDNICAQISEFNEHMVINVEQACQLVFKLYNLRYCMVYSPKNIVSVKFLEALIKSDSSPEFPADFLEAARECDSDMIADLEYCFKKAVKENESVGDNRS